MGFVINSLIVVPTSAEEIITISTLEYPPWTGENLKFNGFVNHVITEAFQQEGYAVKYTYLPWKRAVTETTNGQYAALSYVYQNKDWEIDFYLSHSISVEKIVFFHLKSKPMKDLETLNDLKNYRIGVTRGYTYTKEFWKAAELKQLNVDVTDTDIQNFKKLLNGRIDIFPSGLMNGKFILQTHFEVNTSELISFNPNPLSKTTGHLAFPKSRNDSEKLQRIFNQGLDTLKKEGLYVKFLNDLSAGKYN